MKASWFVLIAVWFYGCKSVETSVGSGSKSAGERVALEKLSATGKVPLLHSAWWTKKWGGPEEIESMPDGGYRLRYRKEDTLNYLWIEASPSGRKNPASPPPWKEIVELDTRTGGKVRSHPQEWRTTHILGRDIKWYQVDGGSGADFPRYETLYFEAIAPSGQIGWYRVFVTADSDVSAAEWLKQVEWFVPIPKS